jgi:5-methylcytosine-specific restriction endonuclease McrA
MKVCTKCKKEKEYSEFKKDSTKPDGHYSSCRECCKKQWKDNYKNIAEKHRAKNAKYAKENPDIVKSYSKKYYDNNKESLIKKTAEWRKDNKEYSLALKKAWKANTRSKKYGITDKLTAKDVLSVYEKLKGRCNYCKRELGLIYTIDHVMPLSREGENKIDNIVIACMDCNTRKGTKTIKEFLDG